MTKALVLEEKLRLSLRDIAVDEPLGRRDVRIALKTVGVCGSDVHYYTHGGIGQFIVRQPMILGHEASGIVLETGADVTELSARRPGLHGAGHSRPHQPGLARRQVQPRPGRAFLGDAAGARHPAAERRPPRRLHLQAARQRVLRRRGDGGAACRRRARHGEGADHARRYRRRDRGGADRPGDASRRLRRGMRARHHQRRRRDEARHRREAGQGSRRRHRRSTCGPSSSPMS